MKRMLIDTSFLFALADPSDEHRQAALEFAAKNSDIRVIPDVTLTEVTYLIRRYIGHIAVMNFLKALAASKAELVGLIWEDVVRAQEIMVRYSDARFDFVDCCIMALSERLDIRTVCTFDRRDFPLFKPRHCDYLELLP